MGTWKQLLQVTTLAVLASACGTSSSTSVTAPSARCAVTATAQPAAVGAPGGSGSIIVSTDRECAWEARSESDWLVLSDASGRGDGTMHYTAAGNPVVSERRGAVVVNGVRVEIGQAAAACAFSLDRSQQSIAATGGNITVTVSAQAGCAWTARSDAPWISIRSGASGQGGGTVSLSVSANAGLEGRSSVVTIAGQPYLIEQAGSTVVGGPGPTPPTDPNCVLTVSPQAASIGAEGGGIEVRVTASAPTCTWTAASAVSWIVMEGGVAETGSGGRRFVVAPNTTSAARVGSLVVAGTTIAVTQAAGSSPNPPPPPPPPPPPTPTPCTYSVSPLSAAVGADGGGVDVAVTASAADCAWTASPGAAWITIQGAPGATGSAHLAVVVAPNTETSPRTGAVSVAGATVTITQAAAAAPPPPPCNYTITPNPIDVGFGGDNDIDLHVITAAGCAWTATSQVSWITITGRGAGSGTGDGHVHIAVAAWLAISGRVGTVTIGGATVTVNQSGILNQEVTLSGTISGLSGSCPDRRFSLDGTAIATSRDTEYPGKGNSCSDLANGRSARVRGIGQADGSILANRIDRIEGAGPTPP